MKFYGLKRFCCLLSLICGALVFTSVHNNKDINTLSVMSVPVTNKVIIVDAGHGGEDRWSS